MRHVIAAVMLALCFAGCGAPSGGQVPIRTVEGQTCCWLSYLVVDVVADPTTGTPTDKATGRPVTWPAGYTAWRAGPETEVRDAAGNVVLITGGRYWTTPTMPDWAIGQVRRCSECELGGGPL